MVYRTTPVPGAWRPRHTGGDRWAIDLANSGTVNRAAPSDVSGLYDVSHHTWRGGLGILEAIGEQSTWRPGPTRALGEILGSAPSAIHGHSQAAQDEDRPTIVGTHLDPTNSRTQPEPRGPEASPSAPSSGGVAHYAGSCSCRRIRGTGADSDWCDIPKSNRTVCRALAMLDAVSSRNFPLPLVYVPRSQASVGGPNKLVEIRIHLNAAIAKPL
ncbi:hypothetical protein DFH07DRAFT_763970 [Mycena maculata]|uniref:Uncharacterized protein n=1 Tax=Mycena maculata TaxID=230809 RepID=A0AAD7KE11_9AGAR|nr:hypothetical protein DFH07DRAFT_763970 [Mycena maculata]